MPLASYRRRCVVRTIAITPPPLPVRRYERASGRTRSAGGNGDCLPTRGARERPDLIRCVVFGRSCASLSSDSFYAQPSFPPDGHPSTHHNRISVCQKFNFCSFCLFSSFQSFTL